MQSLVQRRAILQRAMEASMAERTEIMAMQAGVWGSPPPPAGRSGERSSTKADNVFVFSSYI